MIACPSCGAENEDGAARCHACRHVLSGPAGLLTPDTRIGRYVVLSTLGKGGMGSVYEARDEVLDEVVALKVLPAAADRDVARRFRSEIRLARRITHRNVCRIYDYGEDGGRQYVSMELVEGDDLRELLRRNGPPPIEEGVDIAIQLAEGLQAIHEEGIVHRDIKASNVMRDRKGVIKIMDLGIAKLEDSVDQAITGEGLIVGTPLYMSPEQARGEKVDARSDIYSLGIVLFELFTGHVPFSGSTPIATIFEHLQTPPPLEKLPEAVRTVVGMALAKQPAERFASARDLAEALRSTRPSSGAKTDFPPWPPEIPAGDTSGPSAPAATRGIAHVGDRPAASAGARPPAARVAPLAELSGLTSVLGAASAARDHAFPSRSRLSEPEFGQIDVFICYRRGDSEDVSGRIHDRLVANFGRESVFKDVDSIPPGANFKKYLQAVVQRCLVQLVVIGKNWVDARDEGGLRRLDDPSDWVRIEIEAALQRDVPIIPLLVHSASMPREQQLPPSLSELAYLQGASCAAIPTSMSTWTG